MNNYTIYCTEEQTKKALKLGAPIIYHENACTTNSTPHFYIGERGNYQKGYILYIIPTAEEMIGWLEKQINFIDIIRQENNTWLYIVYPENHSNKNITIKGFSSRPKATLAAIDAALEYLEKNKKKD